METDIPLDERATMQQQFKERLLELGLLTEITPRCAPDAVRRERQPVPIEGQPVSELIIEERSQ